MKKKIVIISSVLLLVIGIGIYFIYGTLAAGTSSSEDEAFNFDILEDSTTVTVPSYGYKIVILKIKNTNDGTVRYGASYTNHSNIEILAYNDSFDEMTGLIKKNEYKFIKLRVVNNTSSTQSTTISTILGYENGGDLIAPSGNKIINKTYALPQKLNTYITNLYNNASKTEVTNNSIKYNYASSVNLMNDRLGGTTSSMDAGNIRYYGANPNNYIYFNCSDYGRQSSSTCEIWRIIGVFGDKVKIIRNDSIGNYSWDNKDTSTGAEGDYGKNDWTTARLMKLLNPSNYYTVDPNDKGNGQSLYWNSDSGTCFSGQNNATTSCDFTSTGIKNDATRNRIAEVTWNLGGWNDASIYSNQIYDYERGTKVWSGRPTVWTGKIGLMYPSDYGYATDFTKCSQTLFDYSNSTCYSNDWLYKSNVHQWLLTPRSSYSVYAWRVFSSGSAWFNRGISDAYGIRPVIYLNADQFIEVGNAGSSTDPFRLVA